MDSYFNNGEKLTPTDPFDIAATRYILKLFSVGSFYEAIMNKDESLDKKLAENVYETLQFITSKIHPEGPFYLGSKFTLIDLNIAPFLLRFRPIFKHYRNFDLVPKDTVKYPWAARLESYISALEKRDSVQKSYIPDELVIKFYKDYAGSPREFKLD